MLTYIYFFIVVYFSCTQPEPTLEEIAHKHFNTVCCKKQCLHLFSFEQCLKAHEWYHGQTQLASRNWLKTVLAASTDEMNHIHLRFEHISVCTTAFKMLYGLSNNKYSSALLDSKHPMTVLSHGNTGIIIYFFVT